MESKNITLFAWIRNQHNTVAVFVALFTNLMAFSQPLQFALTSQNQSYLSLGSDYYNNVNTIASETNDLNTSNVVTSTPTHNSASKVYTKTIFTQKTAVDNNIINAIEKQGIIGKSENLPIDELTDNIFSFELKQEVKKDKDIYLEYELFGLADGSQVTKNINDALATGGSLIKTNKDWTKVRERVNPNEIQKGKNTIQFTTLENSKYQYMVRNLKMVYEEKSLSSPITFHQNTANSYSGMVFFTGYIADESIQKITVLEKEYPVINGVFEVLIDEKTPNASLEVAYLNKSGNKITNNIKIKELIEKPTEVHKSIKTKAFASQIFSKGKSGSLSFAGAKLVVDSLGLETSKNISITGLRYEDLPVMSPEMVNVTAAFNGYKMLPHGKHFEYKPAKVHLKYDETKFPTGYTAKDIKTFYFDGDLKKWIALEKDTLLNTDKEIVSKTTHFTDFINGIIKVPESPETGSFTPTSIKDIKAADPTAGVVSIAPPTPNNMGTLNTSFALKLPAGRAGMQPSLSVNYSSEGGNGWMGLGWDLSIPGVSLDTRWGAPRYDATNETEIYSMGGGMLTLKDGLEYTNPHRKAGLTRGAADKQFYPRIEGSYAKIIRKGSDPTNYWWEVTDKMGNKSFYGGYGTAVVNNAVIKTNQGNISYWGLYRTEDTNGNYVQYNYHNETVSLPNKPGDGGNEFYISEIKYTLKKDETPVNYYKIDFLRDINRADTQVSARNGVVQVTKDLLRRVNVGLWQDNALKPIRSYGFDYSENVGSFYKQQLNKISEFDTSGDLFYSNKLTYEDKGADHTTTITNNNFFSIGESDEWNGASDGLTGDLIFGNILGNNVSGAFSNRGSILGASENGGFNLGGYVGAGPLCSFSNLFTGGINFGGGYSSGGGMVSFNDINGDGLSDKVFRRNGSLFFRPNLGNGFGTAKSINGISNISRNSSDSGSVGVQANFGATVGITYNKSNSYTSTYFSDVNGDGMTDLVDGGSVIFNQTSKNNYLNSAVFSDINAVTQNPIGYGGVNPVIAGNIKLATMDQLRDENPQHDIVKRWIAKKTGVINITGTVTLAPFPSVIPNLFPTTLSSPSYTDYDGVRLSIQKNDGLNSIELDKKIEPTFNASGTTINVNSLSQNMSKSISVNKGDRIYFRVQAQEEGTFDRVLWNPVVEYNDFDPTVKDANGLDYFSSSADNGFILSAKSGTPISDISGSLSISWPQINLTPLQYSDDLIFEIERGVFNNNGNYTPTAIYQQNYNQTIARNINANTFFNGSTLPNPQIIQTGNSNEILYFRIKSKSNINWKSINWNPTVVLTPALPNQPISIVPIIYYQVYNTKANSVSISRITGINPAIPLVIKPVINQTFVAFNDTTLPTATYRLNLVVKNDLKRVIASKTIVIDKQEGLPITIDSAYLENIDITDDITSTIFVEYYTSDLPIANIARDATEPIKAEVYQANNSLIDLAELGIPLTNLPTATSFISSVKFHTLNNLGQTPIPYHVGIQSSINQPNLIKGTTYPLRIQLATTYRTSAKHAAVWIDFDRDGVIDDNTTPTNEFFSSSVLNSIQIFNISIPNLVSDGNILIRVRGGSGAVYTPASFNLDDIYGTVRDYKANIVSFTSKYSKDLYCETGNNDFGLNYRGWGQFAYHGGIIVKRGPYDADGSGGLPGPTEQDEVLLFPNSQGPSFPLVPQVLYRYGVEESFPYNIIPIEENALNITVNPAIAACATDNPNDQQAMLTCLQNLPPERVSSKRFLTLNPDGERVFYFGSSEFVNVDGTHFSTSRMGVKNLKTIFHAPPSTTIAGATCAFVSAFVEGVSEPALDEPPESGVVVEAVTNFPSAAAPLA